MFQREPSNLQLDVLKSCWGAVLVTTQPGGSRRSGDESLQSPIGSGKHPSPEGCLIANQTLAPFWLPFIHLHLKNVPFLQGFALIRKQTAALLKHTRRDGRKCCYFTKLWDQPVSQHSLSGVPAVLAESAGREIICCSALSPKPPTQTPSRPPSPLKTPKRQMNRRQPGVVVEPADGD